MGLLDRILRGGAPDQPIIAPNVVARVEPLEGTNISLWNNQIPAWWAENMGTQGFAPGNGSLAERVWVSNRCMQMNAQQIASMPLRFEAPNAPTATQPAWCSNPDPHWFPNGISDAIFAIVKQLYGWGFSCQYVTDFYFNGLPRTWTVLPSGQLQIKRGESGDREYKLGEEPLDASRIVQIDRDPGNGVRGASALSAYAQQCWGLLAASNQAMSVNTGGIPSGYLKSERKIESEQAKGLQTQWMAAAAQRNGAPPVFGPDLSFVTLEFNPSDLALLENQEFNSRAIATAFGVPAMLLNMAIQYGMTYQNPAALGEMWWRYELRPTAKRIADALTAQMLPAGQWVEFDATDTYLPLDTKAGPLASDEDDTQASGALPPPVAPASPAQKPTPLSVVGGGT